MEEENQGKNEPIIKSEAINSAESFLSKLCHDTFLSLWNYPRVFRNQGKKGDGDGKELCDLIVVSGDDVIIFSDKYCEFQADKKEDIAWGRWFRSAVAESAKQAWGAERWIRLFPDRVFLDSKCTKALPIDLKITEKTKFHLIVVAHGVSKHIEETLDDSGSMMIASDLKGIAAHTKPFTIGDLDPSKSFVHVLDDISLVTLMKMRDTVTDFVDYLNKKEALIRNWPYKIIATGEEELLAVYLTHMNDKKEHDFVFPIKDSDQKPDALFLGPGPFKNFIESEAYKKKLENDKMSYLWDGLIEKIGHHALTATQYKSSPGGIKDTEKIARFMSRESRHERRALSMSWLDMFEKTNSTERRIRIHTGKNTDEPTYIFLLFPQYSEKMKMSEDRYREMRSGYLNAVCMVARKEHPKLAHVIAIATESGDIENRSEDFGYFDGTVWNEEMEKEATSLQNDFGILVKPESIRVHVSEYPGFDKNEKPKRNDLCPCGSGKKYKKCCIGRPVNNW